MVKKRCDSMKMIPTDFYSFTEIGGVGEMIYKAVRFPDYLPGFEFFAQFNDTLNSAVLFNNSASSRLNQYLNTIFGFLWENRSFCRIMLGPNGDMRFVERIKKLVDEKCSYIWREVSPQANERKYEMYNAFIINGCIGIVQKWLNGASEETPDRITDLAATIIINSVESCIA